MCGMNNTGKTYATYAMYGFLDFWHEGYELPVEKEQILALMNHGVASIALKPIAQSHARILKDASTEYIQHLDKIFASKRAAFNNTVFNVEISAINNYLDIETFEQIGINEKKVLQFSKKKGEDFLIVALTVDNEKD